MSFWEPETLADRFRGALVGVAVGDALGAPFEGTAGGDVQALDELAERGAPLRYTDDTAMTIGMAVSLLERGGFDGAHMAGVFARDYAAEPWRGYGATPPRIFALLQQGVAWDEAARRAFGGEGSFGNGAAMRVAPVALLGFEDLDRVCSLAEQTALITHAHPDGIGGAALQALAVAILVRGDTAAPVEPPEVLTVLRRTLPHHSYADTLESIATLLPDAPRAEVVARLGNGIEAHRSVPTALYCFLRYPGSFRDAVSYAISLGGDTDTIAAMTGALSGAALGHDAIPPVWTAAVEGTERIRALADDLLALALALGAPVGSTA